MYRNTFIILVSHFNEQFLYITVCRQICSSQKVIVGSFKVKGNLNGLNTLHNTVRYIHVVVFSVLASSYNHMVTLMSN